MKIINFTIIKIFILLIAQAICIQSYAQSNKKNAWKQINELKEGGLFVKLQTLKSKIDFYSKNSNFQAAEKLKAKQEIENDAIIKAFHH